MGAAARRDLRRRAGLRVRRAAPLAALVVLGLVLAAGCAGARGQQGGSGSAGLRGEVRVFAAASLTDAFQELGRMLEARQPGLRVTLNFGASSALRAQLEQGARADVFASANPAEMDKARRAGLLAEEPRVLARNRLVVIVPRANPAGIRELADLARPGVRLVWAAPEVPIARYTEDVLRRLAQDPAFGPDFPDRVRARAVSQEQDVRQMVIKVALGEADAAIVYASDVTPDLQERLAALPIPGRYNVTAVYPIAVLRDAPNPAGARAFVALALSPEGQRALQRWGFLPAAEPAGAPAGGPGG